MLTALILLTKLNKILRGMSKENSPTPTYKGNLNMENSKEEQKWLHYIFKISVPPMGLYYSG